MLARAYQDDGQFDPTLLPPSDGSGLFPLWLLKHLRNAMTHGVRSDNRDAKPLLQDQQKLDKKLRALRKSLFQ